MNTFTQPQNTVISNGDDCAPPLTPKLAPWIQALCKDPERTKSWVNNFGSPVHVTVTSEFERNVRDLLSPLRSRGLQGSLYFARKANKLPWFVTAARHTDIGVDVASNAELRETLQLGVSASKIVVTAIGKDEGLIHDAIKSGCLLIIDNADELNLIQKTSALQNKTARVGLRIAGFEVGTRQVYSRFGIPLADVPGMLAKIKANGLLNIENLHAHLDRYDTEERSCAAFQLLDLIDYAKTQGHEITSIDLGGGILMRYLDHSEQFEEFTEALTKAIRGDRAAFTFRSDGLGYFKVGNSVEGSADLYPAWNALSKERFISQVLEHSNKNGPLHKQLASRGIKLYFEPGRALLDNAGATLAQVTFRKRDTLGHLLVGVAMNRMNLRPFRAEFCSDPIFLNREERPLLTEGAFLVGNLCSESDLIFRRKLSLGHMPEPGDLVLFANSAGYLAHHMEIGTHGDSLPKNLLLDSATLEIITTS